MTLCGASAGCLRASLANLVRCSRVNWPLWNSLRCPVMPFGGIQVVFGHAVQRSTRCCGRNLMTGSIGIVLISDCGDVFDGR